MVLLKGVDLEQLKEFRKNIHKHPELGNEEVMTTQSIANYIETLGIKFNRFDNLNGGYVNIYAGKNKTICFRADIDALPILERSCLEFSSERKGIMHACGHDMHTAIAAGVTNVVFNNKDKLNCNVVILFQPAEECNPIGGAAPIIQSGFIQKLNITEMYGLHVWPSLPVGEIALRPGTLMGSSDHFSIEIQGKKAHAAEPHLGVDALAIASEIYMALVHRLRREFPPFAGILVSIGLLNTMGRYNVICDYAMLEGTIRSTEDALREQLHSRISEIAKGIAATNRGHAKVKIDRGFGVVKNNPDLFEAFTAFARGYLGEEKVHTDINPSMIGEDFSAYSKVIPSLYLFMGCECQYPLHSDRFVPREETLPFAVDLVSNYLLSRI